MNTGRYFVYGGGVTAAGSFKYLDVATATWSANLSVTNVPSWGTDAEMTGAFVWGETYATGTATAGAASTLTNGAKTWTVNQWTNFQVRIVSGTGIGQIRVIASNTATVLTTTVAWTTNPDTTSVYEITGDEDKLYLIGNNAVTMYRYSISGDAWTVMAPTTARAAAPSTGISLAFTGATGDTNYSTESNNQEGRYLYSHRAGASAVIDRFDIAGGTAGAGAWLATAWLPATETFTTGSYWAIQGKYLYIKKDATGRLFRYDITNGTQVALAILPYPEGAALLGNRMLIKNLDSTKAVTWVYFMANTSSLLFRVLIY